MLSNVQNAISLNDSRVNPHLASWPPTTRQDDHTHRHIRQFVLVSHGSLNPNPCQKEDICVPAVDCVLMLGYNVTLAILSFRKTLPY